MKDDVKSLETGMLSFVRSIQISEGLMSAIVDHDGKETLVPVRITDKGVRGQTSNFMTIEAREKAMRRGDADADDSAGDGKDGEKKRESAPASSNIQTVEVALAPVGTKRVVIDFSLRVVAGSVDPHASNDPEVTASYRALAAAYEADGGYLRLAERYVWNLLNGSFAWRNAMVTDNPSVTVSWGDSDAERVTLTNVSRLSLTSPMSAEEIAAAVDDADVKGRIQELTEVFAEGLSDPETPAVIRVRWEAEAEPLQELFPSQEYLNDALKRKSSSSKVLASVPGPDGNPQASIHSQKIGAAIRRIDDWHGDADLGVIVVNPYSGIQETGRVVRAKRSFYEMREDPQAMLSGDRGELDFVMANLIRGGVLGAAREKKKASGGGRGRKSAAPAETPAAEGAVDG